MSETNRITFVVVNFNNHSYTGKLCESLSDQRGLGSELEVECIVVDNSTDRTDSERVALLPETYPWTRVIRTGKNLGYFGGLNRGLEEVKSFRYLVIGNNDLTFEADFCRKLLAKSYEPSKMVICPDVLTADGVHQNPHVLHRTDWLRRLKFDLYFSHFYVGRLLSKLNRTAKKPARDKLTTPCEVSMGIGAIYILTPEFFDKIERKLYFPWFLYGEEACLSWQVREAGGILWYDPDLLVHHAESVSCSKLGSRQAYALGREAYWGYRSLL